ncbi:hypothetical protein DFH01_22960 [Falsiroseomonas bella]|uniref:RapA2 cadherin-like domain-containing protein n=1 Tax=Falsiroseomonas bella TaxID=2184016 RepID=A0A317F7Q3_9PROT|nr:VCBS domain-containing protein [Falsiroseomonas bella]PWS35170.1 hypothetical protein DFH01_22960 [Falsiroseomonas bella]
MAKAVIGNPSLSSVTEDTAVGGAGNLTAVGVIPISDSDPGQAAFRTTVTGTSGNLGTLILAADGSYTYSVSNSAVQYLGAGQTKVDRFKVTSVDGTSKFVTFTIVGTNDAAVIGAPTAASVTEDLGVNGPGNLVVSGSISISDVDQGQASFLTTVISSAGNLGSLTLNSRGTYTYTVSNSAVQYLGAGLTKVDSFTVSAVDGTTKIVSFTITGVNDAAIIGAPTVSSVAEDTSVNGAGDLTASGIIAISDADQGEAAFQTTVVAAAGNLGSLALAVGGSYTYTVANAAVQHLGAGQTKVDSFTVTSMDGTARLVSFVITGTNDAAVIGDPTFADVTEGIGVDGAGNLIAAGSMAISDADQGQAAFSTIVTPSAGNLGALLLAADGNYTYTVANSAVEYLGAGQSRIDSFTVSAVDGTTRLVTFTIFGADDGAVIGDPTVSSVTEDVAVGGDGNLAASGVIAITDADPGEAAFQTAVIAALDNLGTLVLAAEGSYTYSVANSAVQYLGAGQTKLDRFTVTSLDGTTKVVAFSINGANDTAAIGTPTVTSLAEDVGVDGAGNLTAFGSIAISDADQGQAAFLTVVVPGAGTLGSLLLAADGTYTYAVGNGAVQYLAAGQTKVDSFTVSAVDGTTSIVSFTIVGSNDVAVIGNPSAASVTEDTGADGLGNLTATGSIAISDADQGQAAFQTGVVAAVGNLGSLVLAADGSYTYTVANSDVQYLGDGQSKLERFRVTSVDGTSKIVTFSIEGTNDAALISDPSVSSVTEDAGGDGFGNLTASGNIAISDADQNQAAFSTTVTPSAGNLGSLVLATDGSYTYTVANDAVQYLGAGQSKLDSFTVSAVDGTTRLVSFTINGTNDAAVIGDPSIGEVTEDIAVNGDGDLTASGSLPISDADQGEAVFLTTVVPEAGNLGSLVLATDGSYTYTVVNSDVQYLGAGQSKLDSFTVSAVDGTTRLVSFIINGANDTAVITGDLTGTMNEDGGGASGTVAVFDADGGQADFQALMDEEGFYGTLSLTAGGAWSYVRTADLNHLAAGQSVVDSFSLAALDGTTATVEITIGGVNDAATITGELAGSLDEDATGSNGLLTAQDPDDGEAGFLPLADVAGDFGTLSLTAGGQWTYTRTAELNALAAGVSVVDSFTVTALDGTSETLTITLEGTNDPASITGDLAGAMLEDGSGTDGMLVVADPDTGETSFQALSNVAGLYGTLSLTTAGAWTYARTADLNFLAAGEVVADSFTVAAADGTIAALSVTIEGADDAALITGNLAGAMAEDASGTSGALSVSDPDAGQSGFQPLTDVAGLYGTLSLAVGGAWTYTRTADLNALAAGQAVVDSFVVASADGTSAMLSITTSGANDDATIAGELGGTLGENGSGASGTLAVTDPDAGQASFQPLSDQAGLYGTLSLASTGDWTYTRTADLDSLAAGQQVIDTFAVRALDGTAATLAVTIAGANDTALITGALAGAFAEDASGTSGTISVSDPDAGQSSFQPLSSVAGLYGTLTLTEAGDWTYARTADLNYLAAGSSLLDSFGIAAADGTTATLTVAISGSNDAAVIGGDLAATIATTAPGAGGSLSVTDPDSGQSAFQPLVAELGFYGTLSLTATGIWTYTRTAELGGLAAIDSFTVTALDGTTASLEITLTDATPAQITGDLAGSMGEDDAGTSGVLVIIDPNPGEASFEPLNAASGTYGTLSLTAGGAWTYTRTADLGSLAQGSTVTDTFTVTSLDGTTQVVQVTMNGVNDAPVAGGTLAALTATIENLAAPGGSFPPLELTTVVESLLSAANVSDPDAGAVAGIAITGVDTAHGALWYSTNEGASWSAVGAVNDGVALLLAADARLYFQAATDFIGTLDAALSFRIWDQTSGTAGMVGNSLANGGSTALSAATVTASLVVEADFVALNFSGSFSDDEVYGRSGDDSLNGGAGNDTLHGGRGDDTVDGGMGNDSLAGAAGVDLLSYENGTAGVAVDLAAGTASVADGTDTISGFEVVFATSFGDTLSGAAGNDSLYGFGANDLIQGGLGSDELVGGSGADTLSYADSPFALFMFLDINTDPFNGLGTGRYVVKTGGGGLDAVREFERVVAGAFNDQIIGTGAAETLVGGAGDDTIAGMGGADVLDGGDGIDRLQLSPDGGAIFGNFEDIRGSSAGDQIVLGSGVETVFGGGGNDNIFAGGGSDSIDGGDGSDWLMADHIPTGDPFMPFAVATGAAIGNNTVLGGSGIDTLVGGSGNDYLDGGSDADDIFGSAGNDTLVGGGGADTLRGGGGADIFRYDLPGEGTDQIGDYTVTDDTIWVSAAGFGLSPLNPINFVANETGVATAAAGTPQFIYLTTTLALLFDADGLGAGVAQTLATFTVAPVSFDAAEIVLIG